MHNKYNIKAKELKFRNKFQLFYYSKINIGYKNKRTRDPAILLADPSNAFNVLGWKANLSNLDFIIKTAYEHEKSMIYAKNKQINQATKEKLKFNNNFNKIEK